MDRRFSDASTEIFSELQELEPSPIHSPEDEEKQLPDQPVPTHRNTSSSLGLSSSVHSSAYYCEHRLLAL